MSDSILPESTRPCPKCGELIVAGDANGLCAACLMAEVAHSTVPASAPRKAWEPPSVEEMGRLLPQYRIERMLGRGGMGAVYQGRQVALDRAVAIKILSNDLEEADASFAERFKNEARAMAKLAHPGIVAVHDFGETATGMLYIVMEFVEGTDVAKMIAGQGRLHSEHAMAITAHVCDALAYAHERGIIHRDIKPANIMVGYDGVVKVADFGLAKFSTTAGETRGLTQSGMAMGTLHFMAPEALTLGSAVDHRADIYAVGVMLFQMLTGKLPHGMFELPSMQVQGLDPRYDRIIAHAMREDREQRYQSAREMRHDLDGILTQPVQQVEPEATRLQATLPEEARPRRSPAGRSARPPQRSDAMPEPAQKKSSAGLVLLTLGLLAAISAALFFLGGHRNAPPGAAAPNDSGQAVSTASTTALTSATKDKPFVNTLGMKFVPVPITGGPTDGQRVLFSIWETRVQDYEVFVKETGREGPKIRFKQEPAHPVAGITWHDATGFCAWLTERERKAGQLTTTESYRLPSDHEWSCAVGIGNREDATKPSASKRTLLHGVYPWGTQWPPPARAGNFAGEEWRASWESGKPAHIQLRGIVASYRDGFENSAPVGSFAANSWGLHDLGGNALEWVADAFDAHDVIHGILRGGSWVSANDQLHSSARSRHPQSSGFWDLSGFRCVLAPVAASEGKAVAPSGAGSSPAVTNAPKTKLGGPGTLLSPAAPASATKESPFTNTLGMKFVPVPGTNILMCIHETRRQDYRIYADAVPGTDATWQAPVVDGKPLVQGEDHPVVHVSWEDATAFCQWLGKKEGHTYRLPTDHEWSLAVAIGLENPHAISPAELQEWITDSYPWPTPALPRSTTKLGGEERQRLRDKHRQEHQNAWVEGSKHGNYGDSRDGHEGTAPVMSFLPNHLGIHDLGGNVWEWCTAPVNASGNSHPLRGSGFRNFSWGIVANSRSHIDRGTRIAPQPDGGLRDFGFRCVVELPAP